MTPTESWHRVTAIIRPHRLDGVCDALANLGVGGVTLTDVEGVGQQHGYSTLRSGAWYQSRSHPKVKVETIVANEHLEQVLTLIVQNARTGEAGDGKIWVEALAGFQSVGPGVT